MDDATAKRFAQDAQHNPQAFAALYDAYVDRIFAYVFRMARDEAVAQDLTAVAFEKALRHIRKKRWQGDSVIAWLYRIARNETMSHFRKQKRLLPWQAAIPTGLMQQSGHAPEAHILQQQKHSLLNRSIKQLSTKDQEILLLRFFEDLTHAQIAELLQCSRNTVYVRLHRALKRLRHALEQTDPQGELTNVTP